MKNNRIISESSVERLPVTNKLIIRETEITVDKSETLTFHPFTIRRKNNAKLHRNIFVRLNLLIMTLILLLLFSITWGGGYLLNSGLLANGKY